MLMLEPLKKKKISEEITAEQVHCAKNDNSPGIGGVTGENMSGHIRINQRVLDD